MPIRPIPKGRCDERIASGNLRASVIVIGLRETEICAFFAIVMTGEISVLVVRIIFAEPIAGASRIIAARIGRFIWIGDAARDKQNDCARKSELQEIPHVTPQERPQPLDFV